VLLQYMRSGQINIPEIAAVIIVLFFSMGFHEYAHCLMATWWGDSTPREMGRMTPNPLVHIYWPGFIMFLVLGFGILGQAPVNPRRMRDPRWGSFWTSAAGPLSNLLFAIVAAIIFHFTSEPLIRATFIEGSVLAEFLLALLTVGISANVLLFIFNLLPFFPLDGWRMVLSLLPGRFMDRVQVPTTIRKNARPLSEFLQAPAFKWQDWAQASQFVLMALVVISLLINNTNAPLPDPLHLLIRGPVDAITHVLTGF
jgi:Zn-dependent protease